ncbi:MAG: hypothetical protein HOJ35_12895 [Bdellovibrionales bacterium]|jgi:hypothetical protein|nr:hypothetical protein [Bdellovibrionales bacterium]
MKLSYLKVHFLLISILVLIATRGYSSTCYYDPGDMNKSGDNYYSSTWNCNQRKISKYWDDFNMMRPYWNDGMGYHDVCNIEKPLGRIMVSIYALEKSKNAKQKGSILNWAYDYAVGNISTLKVDCGDGNTNAENFLSTVTFYFSGIYGGKSVVRRSGILLHESRHTRKFHNAGSKCASGGSCDSTWEYGGANQYHVLWLWWFGRHGKNTTPAMKNDALRDARWRHDNRFVVNPGKNI